MAHGVGRRHHAASKRGHEVLVIGVHDDLTPIRQAIE